MMLKSNDPTLLQIHRATVEILEKTGMRFMHPKAIETFQAHGLRVEDDVVYFTEEQLLHYIGLAPSCFTVYARNPKYNMEIGGDNVYVLSGTGPALVGDMEGNTHMATIRDHIKFTKLYEAFPEAHSNTGGIVQPQDVDPRHRMTTAAFVHLLYSDKVIEAESIEAPHCGIADGEEFMKLLSIGYETTIEDLIEHPRTICITDTNSPLMFDTRMLDMLFFCCKYRQPVCVSACSMAGTTGPVTLAGNLALTNAEVLAGIALAQMVSPGTPVLYGSQSTICDLRSGRIAVGSAEAALTYETAAKMAKMYGLPCRGGGAMTDATAISAQSGYESMMTLMATYGAKTNLIFHASGIMKSYSYISPEKLVLDMDMIAMIKRYYQGIDTTDEEKLAVDVIHEVGISGEFLTHEHTLDYMREEMVLPDIGLRGVSEKDYKEKFPQQIYKKIDKLLASYVKPQVAPETVEKMKAYMLELGVREELLDAIIQG